MQEIFKSRPTEMIHLSPVWKGESWKPGFSAPMYNVSLTEFVRPPETVHNWTELLTLEVVWKTSKIYEGSFDSFTVVPDPLESMERMKKVLRSKCANAINFMKLSEERSVPYPSVRFYLACDVFLNGSLPEAQVHQISQGTIASYHVVRIRRSTTLDDDTIRYWEKGLSLFYVCDNSIPEQRCGRKIVKQLIRD